MRRFEVEAFEWLMQLCRVSAEICPHCEGKTVIVLDYRYKHRYAGYRGHRADEGVMIEVYRKCYCWRKWYDFEPHKSPERNPDEWNRDDDEIPF